MLQLNARENYHTLNQAYLGLHQHRSRHLKQLYYHNGLHNEEGFAQNYQYSQGQYPRLVITVYSFQSFDQVGELSCYSTPNEVHYAHQNGELFSQILAIYLLDSFLGSALQNTNYNAIISFRFWIQKYLRHRTPQLKLKPKSKMISFLRYHLSDSTLPSKTNYIYVQKEDLSINLS